MRIRCGLSQRSCHAGQQRRIAVAMNLKEGAYKYPFQLPYTVGPLLSQHRIIDSVAGADFGRVLWTTTHPIGERDAYPLLHPPADPRPPLVA